jgi:hypothetical protein
MAKLEDYLAGKPVNEDMARLMRGVEAQDNQEEAAESASGRMNYADGMPVTRADREHLRRMLVGAGWQVLLKLLDTRLQHQEDAARKTSLDRPLTRKDEVAAAWAEFAADKEARNRIVALAEGEVEKLKEQARPKAECATGTTKTATATN